MSRICIGMPVYNGERFLESALESILGQTHTRFQLLILDNASTDRTGEIGAAYAARDPRVQYHRNATNLGAPRNFNRAFELCRSEYFKWAACDDLLAPQFLEKCVAVLDRDPGVVLCHSKVRVIDAEGRVLRDYASPLRRLDAPRPSDRFRDLVLERHACYDVFGVIRSALLGQTRRIRAHMSSDRSLLAELALKGSIHVIPEPLFLSRDHGGRSVRIPAHQRAREWWIRGGEGRLVFPHWRLMTEYAKAVRRAPIRRGEKLSCYRAVLEWALARWRHLGSDLKFACRESLGRGRGGHSADR